MLNPKKNIYKAFGLKIFSEIPLPELPKLGKETEVVTDIVIEMADLSKLWKEFVHDQSNFFVGKNLFMVEYGNGKFCVKNGEKIIVSPQKGANEEELRLIILGLCMGALLIQRKVIPLHGSAVAINGKAYGFVGDSGAGKSTTALAFLSRGYQLLSDDLMAVSFSPNNTPLVIPAYPQQKLWQETLIEFGKEPNHYRLTRQGRNKYNVPIHSEFSAEPLPLAGIFELVKTERDEVEILPIPRLERLHTLFTHTYANFIVAYSKSMSWHFNTSAGIAKRIDFFQLRRPTSHFTADDIVSKVLTLLQQEA